MLRVNRITEWSSTFAFFLFLFSFLLLLFFLVGGFGLVLLISLRRILLGHRAAGCPAPGQGLPMNVRLKSPAKGDVQSAGHGLRKGAGPLTENVFK